MSQTLAPTLDGILTVSIPELGIPRRGSVRDIYDLGKQLLFITSDRISCFDCLLADPIPHKGQILTEIANFWFSQTSDIITNHLRCQVDPNVLLVNKCRPIPIEVIVRKYVVGSLWRDYEKGQRVKCGVRLPEGLCRNCELPEPILTPSTKSHEGHDIDEAPEEFIRKGVVSTELWSQIEETALKLFKRGEAVAKDRGLVLVDTKYEFGLNEKGELILMDEIHTPDSSRYWQLGDSSASFSDKEYVREYLRSVGFVGEGAPPSLPEHVIIEASNLYQQLCEQLLGRPFIAAEGCAKERVITNLQNAGLIQGQFAPLIFAGPLASQIAQKLQPVLRDHGISSMLVDVSHGPGRNHLEDFCDSWEESWEPLTAICIETEGHTLDSYLISQIPCQALLWRIEEHGTDILPTHTEVGDLTTKLENILSDFSLSSEIQQLRTI